MAIRCQWSTVNDAVAPSRVLTPEAPRTEEAALAFTICWLAVLNTWWVTQADTSTFTATINWSDLRWIRLVGKASTSQPSRGHLRDRIRVNREFVHRRGLHLRHIRRANKITG